MAGRRGFFKPTDPMLQNDFGSEDGGIIELGTDALRYQMIPVRGRRMIGVMAPADRECIVEFTQPVAEFGERTFAASASSVSLPTPDKSRQTLPAGVRMTFEAKGNDVAGHGEIVLRAAGGGTLETLRLGVKAEVKVTVSACRLTDLVTKNPFTELDVRRCIARAKVGYKNCANVTLVDDATIYTIESDIELGNPIILGRKVTEYDQEDSNVLRHIRTKVPAEARQAQLVSIFAWDFEVTHLPLVGMNTGKLCFVEWNTQEKSRAMTLMHELGHGLGLDHTDFPSILHPWREDIERFEEESIEKLNITGNQSKA